MNFLSAKKKGVFTYYGHSYEIEPVTFPRVNIANILVTSEVPARVICEKNPDTMQALYFEAEKVPGFPGRLSVHPGDLPAGSRLMLLRGGGIGDIIMLVPALKRLKQVVGSSVEVIVSTYQDRIPILDGLGCVDRFFPHPIRLLDLVRNADFYVDFSDPRRIFPTHEMVDFHLDCLFIDPSSVPAQEKVPEIPAHLTGSRRVREAIRGACPEGGAAVLFAGEASDAIRHLPPGILMTLASHHPGITFFIPGAERYSSQGYENIKNLDTSGGLADFATAIAECDALVSSDSSAYHIAAGVGTPALVFFGPISSAIRTGYYPLVTALDSDYSGQTCHAPCGISAIKETPPEIPIGANGVRRLDAGVEITTFDGRTFRFDPDRGCPESNATGSAYSPCLTGFPQEAFLEAFGKVLALARDRKAAGTPRQRTKGD